MAIVTLTEALLKSLSATDSRIYRDRILCGFCLKANKRSRTFLVATSIQGKQFRMTLGRWPLISVESARAMAVEVLRECRAGRSPAKVKQVKLPSLAEALTSYCNDKRLKQASWLRYDSVTRTHFSSWREQPVSALAGSAFAEHCHQFSQSNGAAVVELGRGFIGAMIRYVNAVYGLHLENPFHKLSAAGLFRRSELVGVTVADIENVKQGIVIRLPFSKTDQSGYGRKVATFDMLACWTE